MNYKKFRRIETDYVAIAIIAVCLLAIVIFEAFCPSKIIGRAINKSFNEFNARETANEPFLDDEINKVLEKGNISLDGGFSFTEGELKDKGFSFTINKNDSSRTASANVSFNYNGAAALALDAYIDDNETVVKAPVLYDKNIKISTDTLSKNLYSMMGVHYDADGTENLFFDPKADNNTYNYTYENLSKGVLYAGRKAWMPTLKETELKSLEKTEVNGLKCKGYEITIPAEATKAFLVSFGEELFSNADFKNGVIGYCEREYNQNAMLFQLYYGITDANQLADMLIQGYKNMYEQMVSGGEIGDTTIQLYLNSGRLIKAQLGAPVTNSNTKIDITAGLDFNGTNKPTDNLNASIGAESQGLQLKLMYADTNNTEGDKITTSKSITYDNPDSTITGSLVTAYNKADNTFNVNAALANDDIEAISASAKGTVENNKGYINLKADNISIISAEETISAEGHISIEPLSEKITPIEGEAVDVSELSDEEANNLINEVQTKLQEVLSPIEGN